MLLYEFEGKKLFQSCGINIPANQLVSESANQQVGISAPLVLKAQTLSGKRAESGGIVRVKSQESRVKEEIQKLFGKTINGEKVTKILIEEMIPHDEEYYLSFSYSTETRTPIMTFGKGGTGAEEKGAKSYPIDILEGFTLKEAEKYLPEKLREVSLKLWEVFTKYDCELVEINPLVVATTRHSREGGNPIKDRTHGSRIKSGMTNEGDDRMVYALDAKVILDDDADFRRETKYEERNTFGRNPTKSEIEARKIDEGDHRGTSGSVYWDLDGDIAVIAAGGGGSVINMDALIACGGKPANYTEHSGNPPREKLQKLTEIVLSKPGLKGCWFVGGTANFTDIYETLMGFVEGLKNIKPKPQFPIVIRRGGPRDKEAFAALEEIGKLEGFDFHIYGRETPMTQTAKIMVDLAYGKGGR